MTDILDKICRSKLEYVAQGKAEHPFAKMDRDARAAPRSRGFVKALRAKVHDEGLAVIAEIKKASPSAGLIRKDFFPDKLARLYAGAGAACISVLTDEPYFQGHNADLIHARAACDLPVLRKDFMLDVWQIAEARAIGADCILLIMAVLKDKQAAELHAAAVDYGMDVLIEVHDRAELDRALELPFGMIGINNRNLKTLEIDLKVTEDLRPHIPHERTVVSESGISNPAEIARLRQADVHAFLVGESLLKQKDIAAATLALIAQAS